MTLKEWLSRERQADYRSINARRYLKAMGSRINWRRAWLDLIVNGGKVNKLDKLFLKQHLENKKRLRITD